MTAIMAAQAGSGSTVADAPLAVRDIAVVYGGLRAVDGVSMSFQEGAITALIGPNGAGKTSLLRVITGIQRPNEGRVMFQGNDVTRWATHARARAGLISTFQMTRVFPRLSVLDNLLAAEPEQIGDHVGAALFARQRWRRQERAARDRALSLLSAFGMVGKADSAAGLLSGGQRRIVEYLRAVMARPRVMLLDEPTVGLAPWVTDVLATDLARLCAEGVAVILVAHEMELVARVSDSVIAMANGRVVARGDFASVAADEDVKQAYLGNVSV